MTIEYRCPIPPHLDRQLQHLQLALAEGRKVRRVTKGQLVIEALELLLRHYQAADTLTTDAPSIASTPTSEALAL